MCRASTRLVLLWPRPSVSQWDLFLHSAPRDYATAILTHFWHVQHRCPSAIRSPAPQRQFWEPIWRSKCLTVTQTYMLKHHVLHPKGKSAYCIVLPQPALVNRHVQSWDSGREVFWWFLSGSRHGGRQIGQTGGTHLAVVNLCSAGREHASLLAAVNVN